MINNLIQFLQENKNFYSVWVFTGEELKFLEIDFETPCIFRGNIDFGLFIRCR